MSDIYTKCVLTVIAGCLLVIVGRDIEFIPEAHAANKAGVRIYGNSTLYADVVSAGYDRDALLVKIVD